MNRNMLYRAFIILGLLLLNVGCDQITKDIARKHIGFGEQTGYLKDHIILTKIENKGAFMSLGENLPAPYNQWVLILVPALALLVGLIYLLWSNRFTPAGMMGFILVIGGGIGNLIDRILFGAVTDFIQMDFFIFKTNIFNFADVSVLFGVLTLVFNKWKRSN